MSEPFITIRGGAATPQPRRHSTPAVPPPPPPAPGQQGHGGGGGSGGPIPQGVPPAQPQNIALQIPPPPLHAIPADLRGRPAVQVSDIRAERMTEGDAREILTQFKVIRFEKCPTTNEVDAEGKAIKPTWGKCLAIDENDIEQVEARKKVKALDKDRNKEGKPISVTEKKAGLPAALKSQLEKQQAQLQHNDDSRFIYTLVQLEDFTKPLDDAKAEKFGDAKTDAKDKDKKKKEKKYEWDKWDTKKISTEKKSKTKLKERIGVRAYYKRSPGPDQDCLQLLQQHQAQLRQQQQHQKDHTYMMLMHQQQQHHAQMHPQAPPNQQQPQPAKPADVQIVQLGGKKGKRPPRSVHSSDDSYFSDGWSESEGEFETPQSSVGSQISGKHKHRRRERKHHKDKAKYYNLDRTPRTIPVAENLYVVTTAPRGGTPATPISPQPRLPPPVEIERLRSIRYWEPEDEPRRRAIEPAYTYRTVERQRSYPRMSPVETRRDRFDDFDYDREHRDAIARLDRIALEEGRERERRADDAAYERYMNRSRGRRVVVTARGPYEQEPEYHAPYIRTAEPTYLDQEARAEDYIESRSVGFESHPFQPRPRRMVYEER